MPHQAARCQKLLLLGLAAWCGSARAFLDFNTFSATLNIKIPEGLKHVLPEKAYFSVAEEDHRSVHRRCGATLGDWCPKFFRQHKVPTKPVPRGSRDCPNDCSGWGNCNYDSGLCECPAGHGGPDCGQPVKRPCTHRHRHANESHLPAMGHINAEKHDLNIKEPGWSPSRCYGYCNDDLALCMCGYDSKLRYIPPPEGSPPWTPPVQWGRPMMGCQLGVDKDGGKLDWGRPDLSYDDVYGPAGWCNSLENKRCGCAWDGNAWPCDGSIRFESVCANQCSGHGECHMGFCKCHANWYGQDCSRKRAGTDMEPGFLDEGPANRSWLAPAVRMPPAALPTPAAPTRPRPLIFVYDMPPEYTSRFLQYRFGGDNCVWRRFNDRNDSFAISSIYAIEMHMHEMMLQSDHRTFDPEEADFFYVPMYYTCFLFPVMGWADFPWWHAPTGHRPMHVGNMITEIQEWLSTKHPWWNRRGGRDHIWLMPHDEGACYMPTHVFNASIILTHWGRMDLNHVSGTAYGSDDYSVPAEPSYVAGGWKGMDWQAKRAGHPCYDPVKDLVIPDFKIPAHFRGSPLMGAPPLERDILLYFRGEVGANRQPRYSRGIRQTLFHYAHELGWAAKHKIYIGTADTIPGPYSEHLSRSKFCLVAPGDGFSPRLEDSVLHGCVPMIVMDEVHAVFEGILDYAAFSVRVRQADLRRVPEILAAVSPERLLMYQRNLARVWHRFAYGTGPVMRRTMQQVYAENAHSLHALPPGSVRNYTAADTPFRPLAHYPHANDAFSTILQWLHHRIEATR